MKNAALLKMRQGLPVYGFGAALGSPVASETLAASGIDFVMVDTQHGSFSLDSAILTFSAMAGYGATPMARVARNDYTMIGRLLDEGALGIIVPMVHNATDAKAAADACRFPPVGTRSWGWGRPARFGSDYPDTVDSEIFVAVQIESVEAVRNAEAILSTPGVDGCWMGPSDLALSMGLHPRERWASPEHAAAVERVLQACKATGKFAGYASDGPAEALGLAERGFQFLTTGSDAGFIDEGAFTAIEQLGLK